MLDLMPLGLGVRDPLLGVNKGYRRRPGGQTPYCFCISERSTLPTFEETDRQSTARHFIQAADWFFSAKHYPEILWAQVSCNKLHFAAFDVSIAASWFSLRMMVRNEGKLHLFSNNGFTQAIIVSAARSPYLHMSFYWLLLRLFLLCHTQKNITPILSYQAILYTCFISLFALL